MQPPTGPTEPSRLASAPTAITPQDPAPGAEVTEREAVGRAVAPDYELLEELGRGGMAVVYRARERGLQREVALKVLPAGLAREPGFVERFEREARVAAQLEHPNIVPIYRVGRRDGVSYFAMKLLRGRSLAALLQERGRLPPAEIRALLVEVADALGYAARAGVVHRDVKPENIVLDERGHPVVTDFGIAKPAAASALTGTGHSIGTPQYMSPEQVLGRPLDGRSDIYSLGIVAYQCLTGHPPFDGEDPYAIGYQQLHAELPAPALATPEERALFGVIRRMTDKDPARRYRDAEELIAALRATEEGTAPAGGARPAPATGARSAEARAARSVPAVTPSRSPRRRIAAVAGLGLAAALGAALAVGFLDLGPRSRCPRGGGFDLLVDRPGAVRQGSILALDYDVCGLRARTPYRLAVTLTHPGGRSVRVAYDETASGPRTRAHRRLGRVRFPPATYRLDVTVTDPEGRSRSRTLPLLVARR